MQTCTINNITYSDVKGPDWDCPSCGNVNWSWRSTCNKCNGGKPASALVCENEMRDGVGGGFNERQDRVSAATIEIDEDGYDDFGRRVKKVGIASAVGTLNTAIWLSCIILLNLYYTL